MGRADIHIHTRVSDGLGTIAQVLDYVDRQSELDVIAITDHEDATGGLMAREMGARRRYRVEVIPGAEVTTLQGHVLALFVERCPKSFRSIERTIEDIHDQGGLVVIPHPMSWLTRSVSRRTIERVEGRHEPGVAFDGIETHNPSPAGRLTAAKAMRLNASWGLTPTGGSDAHHLAHIGSGWTEFEGRSAEDLRRALLDRQVAPGMRGYASYREVGIRRTVVGLAWGYTATPRKMLRLGHAMSRHE